MPFRKCALLIAASIILLSACGERELDTFVPGFDEYYKTEIYQPPIPPGYFKGPYPEITTSPYPSSFRGQSTIAELREAVTSDIEGTALPISFQIKGIITGMGSISSSTGRYRSLYIQDATGGIYFYYSTGFTEIDFGKIVEVRVTHAYKRFGAKQVTAFSGLTVRDPYPTEPQAIYVKDITRSDLNDVGKVVRWAGRVLEIDRGNTVKFAGFPQIYAPSINGRIEAGDFITAIGPLTQYYNNPQIDIGGVFGGRLDDCFTNVVIDYYIPPDITVWYNGTNIQNGDEFNIGGWYRNYSKDYTFIISNTGTGKLELTGKDKRVNLDGDKFSLTRDAPDNISALTYSPFVLRFSPDSFDEFTASVAISNNIETKNPFTFTVKGTGIDGSPPFYAVFPNSDMEADMNLGAALIAGASYSTDDKYSGDRSLYVNRPASGSGGAWIFRTADMVNSPVGATKIVFYIKGTTTGGSICVGLTPDGGATGNDVWNVGSINGPGNYSRSRTSSYSYTGEIDTQGEWAKIILDISGVENITSKYFGMRLRQSDTYNIYIDDIQFE